MSRVCVHQASKPGQRPRFVRFRRLAMPEGLEPRVVPGGSLWEILLGLPWISRFLDFDLVGNHDRSCRGDDLPRSPLERDDRRTELRSSAPDADAIIYEMRALLQIACGEKKTTEATVENGGVGSGGVADTLLARAADFNASRLRNDPGWMDELLASIVDRQGFSTAQEGREPASEDQGSGTAGGGTGTVLQGGSAATDRSPARDNGSGVRRDPSLAGSSPDRHARDATSTASGFARALARAAEAGDVAANGKAAAAGAPASESSGERGAAMGGEMLDSYPDAVDDTYYIKHDAGWMESSPGVMWNDIGGISASLLSGPSEAESFIFNSDGSFYYLPPYHYLGQDCFTYEITDGLSTDTAEVTINVWNWTPTAGDDNCSTKHDTPMGGWVMGNDYDWDGDVIAAFLVSGPSHAAAFAFNADGSFTYTPANHFVGQESFTYKVTDGLADSNTATVSIDVWNSAPIANDDGTYSTYTGIPLVVDSSGVLTNDEDWDGDTPLAATLASGPSHGTLDYLHADGSFKYTPSESYAGADAFQYYANDGIANSTTAATVTIQVTPKLDLDIEGLGEQEEDDTGSLVVKNADNNNAPRKQIILRTPPTGWSGNVVLTVASNGGSVHVFDAQTGGTEITFNGTDNVFASGTLPRSLYVEGSGESTTMRDVTLNLAAQQGNCVPDSVNFTVLWVDPVDVAFSGSVSNDNESREAYRLITVADHYLLGSQEFQSPDMWSWGTEARGLVHPAAFEYGLLSVFLNRNAECKTWQGSDLMHHDPYGNDKTMDPAFRDDDPTNSDPIGAIYDLDAPGLGIGVANVNTIRRYRANFEAFATLPWNDSPPDEVRASVVVNYYVRFSVKQVDSPTGSTWVLVNDVPGDNAAGYGTTSLAWNLQ